MCESCYGGIKMEINKNVVLMRLFRIIWKNGPWINVEFGLNYYYRNIGTGTI